jgi:adenosylcobinamide-phosphate synthase
MWELTPHLSMVIAAVIADALFGDPVYRYHPVRLIGDLSNAVERLLFTVRLTGRIGGILHSLLVISTVLAVWWVVHERLSLWHPLPAWLWDVALAYSLLCSRDLLTQGRLVLIKLDDLAEARRHLRSLVSRDTDHLDRPAVVRATIESLSENLTDGVLTPLWALCLFGLPGLLLVKTISTLDSMVGYANRRYRRFGWSAARLDDLVHWLPARLSVGVIALAALPLRYHPGEAVKAALRWHRVSSSPNSGWSESACAGALRIRLIGPIRYRGEVIHNAFIGDPHWPTDLDGGHLTAALRLVTVSILLASLIGLLIASVTPVA